ncbi:Organic hydroperoxide reductase OsmC/OhrA [Tenacibaculum sp. MAR_2009_124]|uniref:OsmC family protein n=1 Tax=Tenacibaculum sp. MAR_2009_124 TaxID=1250059 RepID=UPI000898008F|nr:OsmC family protein [Tenacibaculum sp. MAR_2009_124]SEB43459.1 Organic hydroperoxide reductase OsmC/OhrA [Tenacibaculum sp. MAR_2009_124]
MSRQHNYNAIIKWTGNNGTGTSGYRDYERNHEIIIENKTTIAASSDPSFRGDRTKHNPEDLLVSSVSTCHMLWYLHLCSEAGVVVVEYIDNVKGTMVETNNGGGKFTEIILQPMVVVQKSSMVEKANKLHHKANELCYIANSLNFPINHIPKTSYIEN